MVPQTCELVAKCLLEMSLNEEISPLYETIVKESLDNLISCLLHHFCYEVREMAAKTIHNKQSELNQGTYQIILQALMEEKNPYVIANLFKIFSTSPIDINSLSDLSKDFVKKVIDFCHQPHSPCGRPAITFLGLLISIVTYFSLITSLHFI